MQRVRLNTLILCALAFSGVTFLGSGIASANQCNLKTLEGWYSDNNKGELKSACDDFMKFCTSKAKKKAAKEKYCKAFEKGETTENKGNTDTPKDPKQAGGTQEGATAQETGASGQEAKETITPVPQERPARTMDPPDPRRVQPTPTPSPSGEPPLFVYLILLGLAGFSIYLMKQLNGIRQDVKEAKGIARAAGHQVKENAKGEESVQEYAGELGAIVRNNQQRLDNLGKAVPDLNNLVIDTRSKVAARLKAVESGVDELSRQYRLLTATVRGLEVSDRSSPSSSEGGAPPRAGDHAGTQVPGQSMVDTVEPSPNPARLPPRVLGRPALPPEPAPRGLTPEHILGIKNEYRRALGQNLPQVESLVMASNSAVRAAQQYVTNRLDPETKSQVLVSAPSSGKGRGQAATDVHLLEFLQQITDDRVRSAVSTKVREHRQDIFTYDIALWLEPQISFAGQTVHDGSWLGGQA